MVFYVQFRYCNIGWLLTKGDVNGDGYDDLVISSQYASTSDSQTGIVSVLFASQKGFSQQIDVTNLDWTLKGSMVLLVIFSFASLKSLPLINDLHLHIK